MPNKCPQCAKKTEETVPYYSRLCKEHKMEEVFTHADTEAELGAVRDVQEELVRDEGDDGSKCESCGMAIEADGEPLCNNCSLWSI